MSKLLIALVIAIISIGPSMAASYITPDDKVKDIIPGGIATFYIKLSTTDGSGQLKWSINGAEPITAKIDSESFDKHGYVDVTYPPEDHYYTLTVQTDGVLVDGEEYEVQLDYEVPGSHLAGETLRARAYVGVMVPELSTTILSTVGLIGLLGLLRFRRNDSMGNKNQK